MQTSVVVSVASGGGALQILCFWSGREGGPPSSDRIRLDDIVFRALQTITYFIRELGSSSPPPFTRIRA